MCEPNAYNPCSVNHGIMIVVWGNIPVFPAVPSTIVPPGSIRPDIRILISKKDLTIFPWGNFTPDLGVRDEVESCSILHGAAYTALDTIGSKDYYTTHRDS